MTRPFEVTDLSVGEPIRLKLSSAIGSHVIEVLFDESDLERLRIRTTLTPADTLRLGYMPPDLDPFDQKPPREKRSAPGQTRRIE